MHSFFPFSLCCFLIHLFICLNTPYVTTKNNVCRTFRAHSLEDTSLNFKWNNLIPSSPSLDFISLCLIFANSSTPSITQYLSPLMLTLSLALPVAIFLFELHFHQRGLSCKWGQKKENRRRSMRRWAAIYPNRSQAPERLAHLAGSDSEEGMKIDSVIKCSQVIRRRCRCIVISCSLCWSCTVEALPALRGWEMEWRCGSRSFLLNEHMQVLQASEKSDIESLGSTRLRFIGLTKN